MNNYKLNKPKAFEASESITTQSGIEIANLLRSGIKNQTVILVGYNQKWHEIEIESLRIDEETFLENSHLESAAHYIETNRIYLPDMGITDEEIETKDYSLQHSDFMELQTMFPMFDYIQISKLYDWHLERKSNLTGMYHLKQELTHISKFHESIDSYIKKTDSEREKNIGLKYEEVVNTEKPQQEIKVDTVPVPVPVPSDSVSLQLFEKLTPEKITELQGLRIQQEKIVSENPVIVIKDKKTYAEAKKTAAILLSASTSIDGQKGVEATATKYLNTFKTMLKTALSPIAKLTREPYDRQRKLIEDWDNRLLLQTQNRTKELFSVPFVFNANQDSYSVGTLVVTQKDIEELSDADWNKKVEQGKAIVIALESVKNEQDSKIAALEKRNEELAAMLEKFLAGQNTVATEVTDSLGNEGMSINVSENPFESVADTKILNVTATPVRTDFAPEEQKEEKVYFLPNPENKLLNELDLAHISVLEEKEYLQCREYYAQALQDAADAIDDILVNPDKTIQKSVAITELIKTWKC